MAALLMEKEMDMENNLMQKGIIMKESSKTIKNMEKESKLLSKKENIQNKDKIHSFKKTNTWETFNKDTNQEKESSLLNTANMKAIGFKASNKEKEPSNTKKVIHTKANGLTIANMEKAPILSLLW